MAVACARTISGRFGGRYPGWFADSGPSYSDLAMTIIRNSVMSSMA